MNFMQAIGRDDYYDDIVRQGTIDDFDFDKAEQLIGRDLTVESVVRDLEDFKNTEGTTLIEAIACAFKIELHNNIIIISPKIPSKPVVIELKDGIAFYDYEAFFRS